MPDDRLSVWSALSDEGLEKRLRYYLWLSSVVPGAHQGRVEQLVAEAQRRGKTEMVDHAKAWIVSHDTPPSRL